MILTKLFSHSDYLHIHKILGFGCLFNYFLRFYYKYKYGTMFLDSYTPLFHLGLSLSSFIFKVPILRLNTKTIIWKELQLHNIIFTSRSIFIIYHSLYYKSSNLYLFYLTKLGIISIHHYIADIISNKYQNNDKTTTRHIPYDTNNKFFIYLNKKFYAISQIIATTTLLTTNNEDNGFLIMFPIQLSTFLMTLVRKDIISNNMWHYLYSLSLLVPYLLNTHMMNIKNSSKISINLFHIFMRLCLNNNKYINMSLITTYFLQKIN
jgi:hypothetical protein